MKDNTKTFIKFILVVAILAVAGFFLYRFVQMRQYGTYATYEVVAEKEVTGGEVTFGGKDNRLSLCTINGASAIDGTGTTKWNASFGLENPQVVSLKNVAAIADIGGFQVYVVAESGIVHSYSTSYPIVKAEVAQQGVTAVLLDGGEKDYIQIYDIDGNRKVDICTPTKTYGFPVDIALSDDGKKLATLYIFFNGDEIISEVTFYNAGDVGKNFVENITGQRSFKGKLVYDIDFLGNDTVGIILEDGFSIYGMKEIPEKICEIVIDDEIVDMEMYDNGIVTVTKNDQGRKLQFYNLNGKEDGKKIEKLPVYDKLRVDNDEVILYSPGAVSIYRKNGVLKFSGTFDETIDDVYFAGDNRYFLAGSGIVRTIMLLKNVKEENEE